MKLLPILLACLILACFACKGDEAISAVIEDCMRDFYDNAEYLFTVAGK